MDDEFSFPDADLYQHVYNPAPPTDESKSILSLPTEIIVDIAKLNFKTALALMCTNRVLHAAGVTALYARVFLRGWMFKVLDPDAPNLIVPGVLGGLLAKQEHTAALRYLKVVSLPRDTHCLSAFRTLVYRVFERAHGLTCVNLMAMWESEYSPSPRNGLLQLPYPRNLHTLHLPGPTATFAPLLLTAPSLKRVHFGDPCCWSDNTLESCQGPYSQVTSLHYIHHGPGPHTMNGDSLNLFELFPSVERIDVSVGELRKVSGKIFRGERALTLATYSFSSNVSHISGFHGQSSNTCPCGLGWTRSSHMRGRKAC